LVQYVCTERSVSLLLLLLLLFLAAAQVSRSAAGDLEGCLL
jgi:hypothetical protein